VAHMCYASVGSREDPGCVQLSRQRIVLSPTPGTALHCTALHCTAPKPNVGAPGLSPSFLHVAPSQASKGDCRGGAPEVETVHGQALRVGLIPNRQRLPGRRQMRRVQLCHGAQEQIGVRAWRFLQHTHVVLHSRRVRRPPSQSTR